MMKRMREQLSELNKVSRKSVALYHSVALSIGVSDSALGVLYALIEAETPFSQYDLCSEWSIPKQTINTAVAALKKKGLISLVPVPGTRNRKDLVLTDAGRKFAEKTVGRLRDAELAALSELTPEERELYLRLNQKYNQYLAKKLDSVLADKESDTDESAEWE